MGWRENRRRKRTWYRHYKTLCDRLVTLIQNSQQTGAPLAAEAIIKMFFDLYENRKLHKRKRIADSALDSMVLAAEDSGLTRIGLTAAVWPPEYGNRPTSVGEFRGKSPVTGKKLAGFKKEPGYFVSEPVPFKLPDQTGSFSIGATQPETLPLPPDQLSSQQREDIARRKNNKDLSKPF